MPSIHWAGKHTAPPEPASLTTDSIIHPNGFGYPEVNPSSRLILGDNLCIMAALLPKYEGKIDLIYADPPFFTNRKFNARIGRGEDSRKPDQWRLVEGFQDDWNDLDEYLDFLYQRLALMHRLLAPTGTLYLHLDWHASAYARLLLDELFGHDHLLNEIVWTYHGPSPIRRAFNRKHDTILAYVKGSAYTFNADAVREPYDPATIRTFRASPKAGFGKVPDLERGKVPEDWWYFPVVARLHKERTGYPTQKPEALLQRIILASSNPGDTIADFFCGSGTAAVVAARCGRHFLAVDDSFRALHTMRRRLCAMPSSAFRIEREESCELPFIEGGPATVQRVPGGIRLESRRELDYWEVDPEWDGTTFRSAAQAQRPNSKADIPFEIRINSGRRVCVRAVTARGEVIQQVSDV
jgi:site-specific DNA-methyltransferase (adenine-specific)